MDLLLTKNKAVVVRRSVLPAGVLFEHMDASGHRIRDTSFLSLGSLQGVVFSYAISMPNSAVQLSSTKLVDTDRVFVTGHGRFAPTTKAPQWLIDPNDSRKHNRLATYPAFVTLKPMFADEAVPARQCLVLGMCSVNGAGKDVLAMELQSGSLFTIPEAEFNPNGVYIDRGAQLFLEVV